MKPKLSQSMTRSQKVGVPDSGEITEMLFWGPFIGLMPETGLGHVGSLQIQLPFCFDRILSYSFQTMGLI